MEDILLYDTTLRDGTQGANISFTSEEKLLIARRLDDFGIHYIEGGWPGSNPRDMRFFELAKKTEFKQARLTSFAATRRPGISPQDDQSIQALIESETPAVAIFGKSWDLHVEQALRTTLDENLAMIRDSVEYLKSKGREVVYDAEQFFDGYKSNRHYALQTLYAAVDGGADFIVLCDTNGGSLPHEIDLITGDVHNKLEEKLEREGKAPVKLGIHTHNDCGLAVANSIAAIQAGAMMVQGTINGYGERTGNADLTSIIPILCLKMNRQCVPAESLAGLTDLARFVSETANMTPLNSRPFVGKNAFAHKAGVHVNAVMKVTKSYEHMDPELVGNRRRVLVSDLSGKSNIEFKAKEFGVEMESKDFDSRELVSEIKRLEQEGYQFDMAEGSFRLLMERLTEEFKPLFELESFRITVEKDKDEPCSAHAILKVRVRGNKEVTAADGAEPVSVIDKALRKALSKYFPGLETMKPVDFNIRMLNGREGRPLRARVLIETRDQDHSWSTMGVSENIIEASWIALADSFQYKLSKEIRERAGEESEMAAGATNT